MPRVKVPTEDNGPCDFLRGETREDSTIAIDSLFLASASVGSFSLVRLRALIRSGLIARVPSLHSSERGDSLMAKLILLVALAFSITTGSITMLVLNPQPAMACPGHNG